MGGIHPPPIFTRCEGVSSVLQPARAARALRLAQLHKARMTMNRTDQLARQIADVQLSIGDAEQRYAAAVQAAGADPGNPETREAAREAAAELTGYRNELAEINSLLAAARQHDRSDSERARRQRARAAIAKVQELAAARNTLGQEVDRAMLALTEAVERYIAAGVPIRNLTFDIAEVLPHQAAGDFRAMCRGDAEGSSVLAAALARPLGYLLGEVPGSSHYVEVRLMQMPKVNCEMVADLQARALDVRMRDVLRLLDAAEAPEAPEAVAA